MPKYSIKRRSLFFHKQWVRFTFFTAAAVLIVLSVLHLGYKKHRYSDYLLRALDGPVNYDNPRLLRYIRDKVIEPPSTEPYGLLASVKIFQRYSSEFFYENFTKAVFGSKKNGFFVEVGAMDGQTMSNTLALEVKQGWTGLLIEPDPSNYNALKKRRRKAWTAKACLSIYQYPKQENFSSLHLAANPHESGGNVKLRAMGSIITEFHNNTISTKGVINNMIDNSVYVGQCFPLASFLLALNRTRIDLLSLDVEFIEEDVIKNFDFNKIKIQVMYVEWWNHEKLPWLKKFMESKGYRATRNRPGDIIFVRNNSEAMLTVEKKRLWTDIVFLPNFVMS